MPPSDPRAASDLDLPSLARLANLPVRTVRYYQQLGLLSKPGRGPGARYAQADLNRLILIRALQSDRLPLADIQRVIDMLDDEGVERALDRASSRFATYRDYLSAVFASDDPGRADAAAYARTVREDSGALGRLRQFADLGTRPARGTRVASRSTPPTPRETWDRTTLSEGVELHTKRPLTRDEQRLVDELRRVAARFHRPEDQRP